MFTNTRNKRLNKKLVVERRKSDIDLLEFHNFILSLNIPKIELEGLYEYRRAGECDLDVYKTKM